MTETHPSVSEDHFEEWITALLATPAPTPTLTEVGKVTEVGVGVAVVSGLARALADEVLVFASGVRGIVLDLQPGRLGVILLGPSERITLGEEVHRTRKVVSVPVGPAVLGRLFIRLRPIIPIAATLLLSLVYSMILFATFNALRTSIPVAAPIEVLLPGAAFDTVLAALIGPLAISIHDRRTEPERLDW